MSNDVEIVAVRQLQLRDKDRGFFKVKEVTYKVGNTNHTLRVSMTDFNNGKLEELVMAEAEKIRSALGKKK